MEEDLIYIADGWNGLRVLNWSNPSQPILVGQYCEESNSENVCAEDGYIYLSYGLNGMAIVIFDANNNGIPDITEKPIPTPTPTPTPANGPALPIVFATLIANLMVIIIVRRRKK